VNGAGDRRNVYALAHERGPDVEASLVEMKMALRAKTKSTTRAGDVASKGARGGAATRGAKRSVARTEPTDHALRAAHVTRLRRAEGQVRGIIRMIEQDRPCADTIIQIAAAQESLRAVAKNLLKNHLKHCARAAFTLGQHEAEAMCSELMDVMSKIAR